MQPLKQSLFRRKIPHGAGVGLKAEHYARILEERPTMGFFEVHAENYMGPGGPPHRYLSEICRSYPLSIHGVGLSIGADRPLDPQHLKRLKLLLDRYQPALFSEHLAWSSHNAGFFNDLLPVPYTNETLSRVVEHIDEVQETLGRPMLLENPSSYLAFEESTYAETDFITEIIKRSGCGLLLDVNNVFVACTNQQWDVARYISSYPMHAVEEIHLAGHAGEVDEMDRPLLIDSHDRPVDEAVWQLYERVIAKAGHIPTLIEWDTELPDWPVLQREAMRAEKILFSHVTEGAFCDLIA